MKIGFDAKRAFHNSTGLGNYSRDLIKILATYYAENEYYLYNPKPKKIDKIPSFTHVHERLPTSFIWKKLSSIWRQSPIVNQLLRDDIDIYHGLSGEIPRNGKLKQIKSVVTIHDLIFLRYPELYKPIDRKIYLKKFKYAAENATKIIAISKQTKQDIIDFFHIDSQKIEVVYQGCHSIFKTSATPEATASLREKYNLPDRFLLNVGTIEKRKNLLSILKAITDIDVNLVVVGRKTDYFQEVESFITENNLTHRVHFLEGLSLSELANLYQLAEIFIYPSIIEGFGIPIIESLFSGTPVITTSGGVFPEAGGPHSIYVPAGDILALKEQIYSLLRDESRRSQMIEKGYEYAQKFTDENIASNLIKVYKSIE